jgi:peptide deformylase
MPLKEIVHIPHPALRKKAQKVTEFGADLQMLIDDMTTTLRNYSGAGLAAPQVNESKQVILVEYGDEENEDIPPILYIAINPKISRFSKERITGAEGCLSIPGMMGEVERSRDIVVEAQNRKGEALKLKLSGWTARIFQHEIDHLDGILFTDRTTDVWETDEEYNPV